MDIGLIMCTYYKYIDLYVIKTEIFYDPCYEGRMLITSF